MMPHMYDMQIIQLACILRDNSSDKVRQYLEYGFIPRAFQIKESYSFLSSLAKDRGIDGPLDKSIHSQANIYLNSFFYNIFGAIDNLAWIIKHSFKVLDDIDELQGYKSKISFYKKEYIEDLGVKEKSVQIIIQDCYWDFLDEIRSIRDLTAHRLPLHIPVGYLPEEDTDLYNLTITEHNQKLHEASLEISMDEKDKIFEESTVLLKKANSFKKFKPIVVKLDHSIPVQEEFFFNLGPQIEKKLFRVFNFFRQAFKKANAVDRIQFLI